MASRGRYNSLSASTSTLDECEWKSSTSDSFNSGKESRYLLRDVLEKRKFRPTVIPATAYYSQYIDYATRPLRLLLLLLLLSSSSSPSSTSKYAVRNFSFETKIYNSYKIKVGLRWTVFLFPNAHFTQKRDKLQLFCTIFHIIYMNSTKHESCYVGKDRQIFSPISQLYSASSKSDKSRFRLRITLTWVYSELTKFNSR